MQGIAEQPKQLTVMPAALTHRMLGKCCSERCCQRVASERMLSQPLFKCTRVGEQALSPMLRGVHEGSVRAVA